MASCISGLSARFEQFICLPWLRPALAKAKRLVSDFEKPKREQAAGDLSLSCGSDSAALCTP